MIYGFSVSPIVFSQEKALAAEEVGVSSALGPLLCEDESRGCVQAADDELPGLECIKRLTLRVLRVGARRRGVCAGVITNTTSCYLRPPPGLERGVERGPRVTPEDAEPG